MSEEIERLRQWVAESDNIVFFGGAGVSTESGIPDFRSVDGLYNQQWAYPPETILSHSFFERDPEEFYRFYHAKLVVHGAKPNAAHLRLAALEREGKLKAILTQNIDGLHQAAGSKNVLELHGSTARCYCARCRRPYPADYINDCEGVPKCEACGGVVRPDVVLYEESLDEDVLQRSVMYISRADMLIIGGTSLAVYPAAGLINYYQGHKLALVNRGQTPRDGAADLIVRGNIGEVFSQI
ncbi:MAG: NAD-dependent protein deacylase [Oscillospiraceae bacterium]|nr:NAD-dependent protein deacylase [Oscillospiraceae bacterium]